MRYLQRIAYILSFVCVSPFVLGAAAADTGGIKNASVSVVDGARVVQWDAASEAGSVTIEVSRDPKAAAGEGDVIAEGLTTREFVYADGSLTERVYFTLIPQDGEPMKTALRVLPLEGGRNFRDLGGYQTEDGKTVKWGHVFRSGTMTKLTDADYIYLGSLGIGVVCDFRSVEERGTEPTDWRAGEIDYIAWDYTNEDTDSEAFAALFQDPELTPEKVTAFMTDLYHEIAYQHAERYTVMFDRLAKGEIPLAFNCSAGKDRAGTAAALLLTALGVPRETVIADYALSEQVVDYLAEYTQAQDGEEEEGPYAFLRSLPPEILMPLMRSDPRYIEATFKTLEEKHGSVLAFIQSELNVTDDELAAIRAQLLE